MDRWQAMRIFARVAETGSFAETARLLHLSAPAVTRAVASLEELIGARLLVRTTRS
ncbi:LysR family transcriptional regulator, partial [Acinetobacter baumannii]